MSFVYISVSYRYRKFRPVQYQYRIGIGKSGIEDLWSQKLFPKHIKSDFLITFHAAK